MSAAYPYAPAAAPTDASRETARQIRDRAIKLRRAVYALLGRESLTTHELAARLGETVPSVQPRVSELKTRGLIEETGQKRTNAASGKPASVYRRRTVPAAPQAPKAGTRDWWKARALTAEAEVERLRAGRKSAPANGPLEQLNLLEVTA